MKGDYLDMPTQEEIKQGELTGQNVGPGDQTISMILQPGTAFLDYYARTRSNQFDVYFAPQDPRSNGTVQVDFGPKQPLKQGLQQVAFNQVLQIVINNVAGATKYGWIVQR